MLRLRQLSDVPLEDLAAVTFDTETLSSMAWIKPQHKKGRIDWAGELLSMDAPPETAQDVDDYQTAINIMDNWRAVHSYPLQAMKMALKTRAKRICPTAVVAQRLKRLASIKLKLLLSKQAGHHPSLSQMQDIGGCRAIMDTVDQVRQVESLFADSSKKSPNRGPQYSKTTDYIAKPKSNGYRGVHLVYRFRSDSPEHSCYNGQRIEIQLRSRLQHYWATAVETYSTFSGQALKSNIGPDDWKRFFVLVSSVIAIREHEVVAPDTPTDMNELVAELRPLYESLRVHTVLSGWASTARFTENEANKNIRAAALYLLVLNPDDFSTTLYAYSKDALAEANAQYASIEKENPNLQAVLVSVDSVVALRTAYPNYFLDTTSFLGIINEVMNA